MPKVPERPPELVEIPPLALRDLLTIAAEAMATFDPDTLLKLNKDCVRELMVFLAFASQCHPEETIRRHSLLDAARFKKLAEE